jgi:hypothetical protein
MHVVHRGAIVVALVLMFESARADDPPPVEKLIEQLGSPSFPVRERATKQLQARGPAALPALRKALESKDEEVRKRAESLVPVLEIEEALLPKRITLSKPTDSALIAVQEIAKQTGYKVEFQGKVAVNFNSSVKSVAFSDIPFWEAMEKVERGTGTHSFYENYQKTLFLQPAGPRTPSVQVRGPFRLEAVWFHEDRDVDLAETKPGAGNWRNRRLTLAVNVQAEPRITFLKVNPAKVEEATDSEGNSLLEPEEKDRDATLSRSGRGSFRGESLVSSDVRLRRASETAKTAKVIRGTIPVKAILIHKPMVVTAKVLEAAGKTIKAGEDSLVITNVTNQGGNSIEIRVQVPRFENDPYRQWNERFKLTDADGIEYQMNGGGSSSNGREYTISMYYSPPWNNKKAGPPAKLVFDEWVVHEHAIPFEFRDLPIP